MLIHARILLKADVGDGGPGWDDERIAEAVECGASTVYRVRRARVEEGLAAALFRKKPTGRQYRKLDGAQEARLIALVCAAPPEGRSRWTMRRLADRLVRRPLVSIETDGFQDVSRVKHSFRCIEARGAGAVLIALLPPDPHGIHPIYPDRVY